MLRLVTALLGSGLCVMGGWLGGDLFIGILMGLIVSLVAFLLMGGDRQKANSTVSTKADHSPD